MLVYPAGMNVSTRALRFVTDALLAHRRSTRTRWRVLSSGRQALMVLAHLRKGETYRDLAAGFGVGTTTAYRTCARHCRSSPPWRRPWNRPYRWLRRRRT